AHRMEQLNSIFSPTIKENGEKKKSGIVKEKKKKTDKTATEKVEKVDSKEESFKLYKQGNNIEAIAKTRGMAITTIEGHLAYFITKGELSANNFLPPEKIDNIITVSKKLDTFQFAPIKQALGDEYSYGDIKIAI